MPLLGFAVQQVDCYLLFPYCSQSLRSVVNQRNPLLVRPSSHSHAEVPTQAPWPEVAALKLFWQICSGVQALHSHGYSHRDIKLENVLLYDFPHHPSQQHHYHAVLMDFGSAGPVTVALTTRRDVLELVEQAAQHTTMPYRPPELWEGGVRHGVANDVILDYRCVDVWSLGCTLHALLYGASPFECEFLAPQRGGGPATMRIVECTHLSILGHVPIPRYAPISSWYSSDIRGRLLEPMLTQDRMQRPTLESILNVVEELIQTRGGTMIEMQGRRAPWADNEFSPTFHDEDGGTEAGDGIALMSRVV
jgi:serine/threonine protein kinase